MQNHAHHDHVCVHQIPLLFTSHLTQHSQRALPGCTMDACTCAMLARAAFCSCRLFSSSASSSSRHFCILLARTWSSPPAGPGAVIGAAVECARAGPVVLTPLLVLMAWGWGADVACSRCWCTTGEGWSCSYATSPASSRCTPCPGSAPCRDFLSWSRMPGLRGVVALRGEGVLSWAALACSLMADSALWTWAGWLFGIHDGSSMGLYISVRVDSRTPPAAITPPT
mmetsp:Transcript_26816/g.58473  ORF Transcript_26816/g.58473 Transcript_26816/m.58473 type:complete len:226 (-) Transcript_26816:2143-2820(-)